MNSTPNPSPAPHNTAAGVLKFYLQELPEPLMTFNPYEERTQIASVQDQDKKLQDLWRTCQKLPPQNFVNFRYLNKFLAKLVQTSDINKMTLSSLAIVLGTNFLWAKNEGTLPEMAAATSIHVVVVIKPNIQCVTWLFPKEVEFNMSEAFVPLTTPNSSHSSHTGNNPVDSGTLERKWPASMVVMEADLVKKESFGVKLMDFQAHWQGGTLNRKHSFPSFQLLLRTTDGSTWLQWAQSLLPRALGPKAVQGVGLAPPLRAYWGRGPARATAVLQSPRTLPIHLHQGETAVRLYSPPTPTPGPVSCRLPSALCASPPPAHKFHQPEPTQKPASQPSWGLEFSRNISASTQPVTKAVYLKPFSPYSVPRPGPRPDLCHLAALRTSEVLQQPVSDPSPQPPAATDPHAGHTAGRAHQTPQQQGPPIPGAPSEPGLQQLSYTPSQTPTPPSTPPLGKQNLSQAVSNSETAQQHAGTLPRPKPVPKPGNWPNVPSPAPSSSCHPSHRGWQPHHRSSHRLQK
ncbi:hypothetical protein Celaphus_00009701 [Cervus elaphus hippelaphus]|uniref:Rho-GAP domain-containing protein n=1 Tax=Cervus elaphus hippelaphus TaxID=46360 RepID=A0A212C042_CEREH|nr:hypothetical protein Celaphus_00009701 [Cervus elaphus hippelaphus]